MKEMKDITKRLKKGPLEVQEYGRQQLQGMLSVGPYAYLQLPTPKCSASISDEHSVQLMVWEHTVVQECEAAIIKVYSINCKLEHNSLSSETLFTTFFHSRKLLIHVLSDDAS
jgi:hypothetical protein